MTLRCRVVLVVLAFSVGGCAPAAGRLGAPDEPFHTPSALRVQVRDGGRTAVRMVPLDEYVHAAILAEFAPAAGEAAVVERMYEVQAMISRTYAVASRGRHAREGFDVCSTTHCQLYDPDRLKTSRWAESAGRAVRRTAGMVLWHGQAPVSALFHADCGGRTSDAADVWGGQRLPYLASARDDGPAEGAHAAWTFAAGRDALRQALNASGRTRVGARLDAVEIGERDAGGRAATVVLRGEARLRVRGEDFRAAVTRAFGARSLRSTRFDVRRSGEQFVFEGSGFGHGVGLCQAGALARLKAGRTPQSVLRHYYPGTRLVR